MKPRRLPAASPLKEDCWMQNVTDINQKMRCPINSTLLTSMMPPVLMVEFVFGILGNGLALLIFCFHLRPWKSSTVLLFNLALADFLLNFALPLRASYYSSEIQWKFGAALCNITLFMLASNRSGSTLFLMAIAVDRYMRVVCPHHPINSLGVSKAACGAAILWVLTFAMTVHILATDRSKESICESFITDTQDSAAVSWHRFAFLFSFFVPLLVILFCTGSIIWRLRGRQLAQQAKIKRALCFVVLVVVIFIICFLPSVVTEVFIWVQIRQLPSSEVCAAMRDATTAFYITISLTYLNSMLDPVVYYFSSTSFKNICRKLLHLRQIHALDSSEKKTRESASQHVSNL